MRGDIGKIGNAGYRGVTVATSLYRADDGGVTWAAANLGGKSIVAAYAISSEVAPLTNG